MDNLDELQTNQLKGSSILLVDDNSDNIFTLSRRLNKEGYKNLQTAVNGTEALRKVGESDFDLILLDLHMPDIEGAQILKQLKDDPKTENIPVLMISGDDTIENIAECIRYGAEDFLPKPFNVDILRARVSSSLKKRAYIKQEIILKEKLSYEKQQYRKLLEAIFPEKIIRELMGAQKVSPFLHKDTSIIFTDISEFTDYCSSHTPQEIFDNMQAYVTLCEELAIKHKLEKIKTIGDAFMAACGMFEKVENPVLNTVLFALELIEKRNTLKVPWDIHIGIDYGDIIAGIVGNSKYLFDIWGDKVNTAARIQGIAKANSIYISCDAWQQVKSLCEGQSLGKISLKGKGQIEIFEVTKVKNPS